MVGGTPEFQALDIRIDAAYGDLVSASIGLAPMAEISQESAWFIFEELQHLDRPLRASIVYFPTGR